MVLSALSAPSHTSVNTWLLELLCSVTLTFSSRKQVPPKLSDDFCVGCVGSCPLLLWGPAGRGLPLEVCLHLLLLSLSGRGPTHQNAVFLSGPCHSMVIQTLGAKSLLFLLHEVGETAQRVPDGWAGVIP